MGQPQPEAEPHGERQQEPIDCYQQQAALHGRQAQQDGGEDAESHKKIPCRDRGRGQGFDVC
jgi:hypothetical protein